MPNRILKIIVNGVTGRMGRTQHLARSIMVAIRQQGGLQLHNGETLWPEPILVGRNDNLFGPIPAVCALGATQYSAKGR
jgi:hypothetical protein